MPKYSIAFVTPEEKKPLRHQLIESVDEDAALKEFFKKHITEFYSNDEQGYYYFKEDFFDKTSSLGSLITVE